MQKRIFSLFLALTLLMGVFVLPVSAASAKDVYNYLVKSAKDVEHNATDGYYRDAFYITDEQYEVYAVYYWEDSREVEVTLFTTDYEVTMIIPGSPAAPYTAYVKIYNGESTFPTGKVRVNASYNGSSFSSFSEFSGNTSYKSSALNLLNNNLPALLELTRAMLYIGGYKLSDLGLTSYKSCIRFHCYNSGTVTTQPTCVSSGIKTSNCTVCGKARYEDIPATGVHAWKLTRYLDVTQDGTGYGLYTCANCGAAKQAPLCAAEVFTDMPQLGNWAHDPIDWAYFNGITNGTTDTTFSPKNTCTRGQVVTFLWNAAGKPAPSSTYCAFTDVKEDAYYYTAMLWAVERGITKGKTSTTFAPRATCTRGEVVTFLWNAAGQPEPYRTDNPFTDVQEGKFYCKAVLWAVENGITNGKSANLFAPKDNCTRAQVVTFLYKSIDILNAAAHAVG